MPEFRIEFIHEGEKEVRTAVATFTTGREDLTFSPQYLDWEEQYFDQHNEQLIDTKAIIALEDLPEFGVMAGAVVWRDWCDLDPTTSEGEQHARQLLEEFKPVWDDPGIGLDGLLELMAPLEPWERNLHR